MSSIELVIRGKQVVLANRLAATADHMDPERGAQGGPASIHIADGRIVAIESFDHVGSNSEVVTADDESIVMPGLVDTHVHINEPGRSEWEGFSTATRAAAAGGVTTLIDMPLNSIPPTTTPGGLEEKLLAARGQCSVDVGFWGGLIPGNTHLLDELYAGGVVGFKCFLVPSGVDEFPNVTEAHLRAAMPELVRLGALLIVHAELPGPINEASAGKDGNGGSTEYETFLSSRPRAAENEAVELMIRLSREFGAAVHIVHHSSADALPMLRDAKTAGVKVTAETCPHYLCFVADQIPAGATEFKCCPPIRERENREQLWQALADGTIDMIVSDHSPCPPEMKLQDSGDFLAAWGGIASLQLRLPVMWTEARRRGFSVLHLAEWLCAAPARLAGLDQRKGSIMPGTDADIVIWSPDKEFRIGTEMIQHRHKVTPYTGRIVQGVVQKTFLRGRKIYDDGHHVAGNGKFLLAVR